MSDSDSVRKREETQELDSPVRASLPLLLLRLSCTWHPLNMRFTDFEGY